MFETTSDKLNNWRWDNPYTFTDQVDDSNPQTTGSGKVKITGEHFSWYSSDHIRGKIGPQSCRQYKPGNILAVRPLNWDEIIEEDNDNKNWVDPGGPSSGRSHPHNGDYDHEGEGEQDRQGGDAGTRKGKGRKNGKITWKATQDRKGKGMGKRKGNGKGKGNVQNTPGGDNMSRAVALQLQNDMREADNNLEG